MRKVQRNPLQKRRKRLLATKSVKEPQKHPPKAKRQKKKITKTKAKAKTRAKPKRKPQKRGRKKKASPPPAPPRRSVRKRIPVLKKTQYFDDDSDFTDSSSSGSDADIDDIVTHLKKSADAEKEGRPPKKRISEKYAIANKKRIKQVESFEATHNKNPVDLETLAAVAAPEKSDDGKNDTKIEESADDGDTKMKESAKFNTENDTKMKKTELTNDAIMMESDAKNAEDTKVVEKA